jgi:hypothetical protein
MTNGKDNDSGVSQPVIDFWDRYIDYLEKGDDEGCRAALNVPARMIIDRARYATSDDEIAGVLNSYITDMLICLQLRSENKK